MTTPVLDDHGRPIGTPPPGLEPVDFYAFMDSVHIDDGPASAEFTTTESAKRAWITRRGGAPVEAESASGGGWTDHTGTVHKALGEDGGGEYATQEEARQAFIHAVRYLDEHKTSEYNEEYIDRRIAFQKAMKGKDGSALEAYTSFGYDPINKALKGHEEDIPANVRQQIDSIDQLIATVGSPAPDGLVRGKGMSSRLRELEWQPGKVFEDPNYGSWSSDAGAALKFTTTDTTGDISGTQGPRAVVIRMVNSAGVKSIPGLASETETLIPRGMQYEVVGVQDFTAPSVFGVQYRIIDVKILDKDTLVASAEFKATKNVAAVPRDADGRWTDGPGAALKYGAMVPAKRGAGQDEWFASDEETAAAQKLTRKKTRDVPEPSADKIAKNLAKLERAKTMGRAGGDMRGNSTVRRERGEALFKEFGGGKNGKTYCPCGHCGLKVSPRGRDGHAAMQQDKILVAGEGGDYGTKTNFPNIVPSCGGCNAARGDTPMKTRPRWDTKKRKASLTVDDTETFASNAADALTLGGQVTALPIGHNNPDIEWIGRPVQGLLGHRTVNADWGSYEQWLVGGECVDPDTIEPVEPGDAGAEFTTTESARRAWVTRRGGAPAGRMTNLSADEAKAVLTIAGDGYTAEPTSVEAVPGGQRVQSTIFVDGEEVGWSSRVFTFGDDGPQVEHESFELTQDAQGKGLGAKYLRDAVDAYADAGIVKVTVIAASNQAHAAGKMNGAYTWARLGFEVSEDASGDLAYNMLESDILYADDSWQALAADVEDGRKGMADILAHPTGKEFLLGAYGDIAWKGEMPVKPKKKGTLVASADSDTIDYELWAETELSQKVRDESDGPAHTSEAGTT